jgi:hypothetical protein
MYIKKTGKLEIAVVLLIFIFFGIQCTTKYSNEIEIINNNIVIDQGRYSLKIPADWERFDVNKIEELKGSGFIAGFGDRYSSNNKLSYFLVKPTNHRISKKHKLEIITNTPKLKAYSEISSFFTDETKMKETEFYDAENDIFITLFKYDSSWPDKSIMIKRFDEYGALVIHYYCGENLKQDLKTIEYLAIHFKSKYTL